MIRRILGVDDPELFTKVGAAVFAYLFRRISHKRFRTIIQGYLSEVDCEKVINEVRTNGYLLKNCKAYAWKFYKSRYEEPSEKPNPKEFKIHDEDVTLLQRINLSHINLEYPAYSLREYQSILDAATSDKATSVKISKFVSKRMLFLIKSYGVERHDLENECRLGALRAIYMRYPQFESLQHVRNTATTGIHNAGEDLVKYHTSPARQRLQKTKDGGFEARNVDLATLPECETPYAVNTSSLKEDLAHLEELLKKLTPIEQAYMSVLKGEHHEGFSRFLGQDNRDAVESMAASRYRLEARRFFGISNKQGKEIFAWLRQELLGG